MRKNLALFFFFTGNVNLPDLHSFPTRRSSDLTTNYEFFSAALGEKSAVDTSNENGPASITLLDRKSTRLNSSHTVISYAVFCLKKKNASFHFPDALEFGLCGLVAFLALLRRYG